MKYYYHHRKPRKFLPFLRGYTPGTWNILLGLKTISWKLTAPFKTVVFWEDVRNFSAGRRFSSPNCSLIFLKFRSEIVLKTIIHEKELLAFFVHGKAVGSGIILLMQEGGFKGGWKTRAVSRKGSDWFFVLWIAHLSNPTINLFFGELTGSPF